MPERITSRGRALNYIRKRKKARVEELRRHLGVSRQLIHRHLRNLIRGGLVVKSGKSPLVFYEMREAKEKIVTPDIPAANKEYLDSHYFWVSPTGDLLTGFKAFKAWAESVGQSQRLDFLAREYIAVREKANAYFNRRGFIDATRKIEKTFNLRFIDKVFYSDFYSLPKYGKTRLGQLVLYAKQAQKINLIKKIGQEIRPKVREIIRSHKIGAIGFIPPTVPRQIQFLKELEKILNLNLPKINFVKAYRGEIPVAQKTLSRLEERIENARRTIFIKDASVKYNRVLLIDDAVGSGASLNETAKKLKEEGITRRVIGFAIVGSYKGFDVIREI
ncbi:MarR family transcriptional regulator [Candidatus Shapirobacteria bacterium]|nr:MarR family transcriptional regulator [Candidatus Shapirobacteria bacterium]